MAAQHAGAVISLDAMTTNHAALEPMMKKNNALPVAN